MTFAERIVAAIRRYSKIARLGRPLVVLDVGPGLSPVSRELAQQLPIRHTTFVDFDRRILDFQRDLMRHTPKVTTDYFKVDLEKEALTRKLARQYDVVICTEVLEHVDDDHAVLTAITKLLRHDGLAIISVPSRLSERLFAFLNKGYMHTEVGHVRQYTESALIRLFRNAGLRPLHLERIHSQFVLLGALVNLFKIPLDEATGEILKPRHPAVLFGNVLMLVLTKTGLAHLLDHVLYRNYFVVGRR